MRSLRFERKARNLCISGAAALQLASIEKEFVGGHGAELGSSKHAQLFLQTLEIAIRFVGFLPPQRARTATAARQRQVWAEWPIFFQNTERGSSIIDSFRQRRQFRRSIDSN